MIEGFNYNRHPLRPRVVLTELLEAAGYILHNKTVLSMTLLIASFMLLLTPVNMGLMPVYADEVFSGGPELLGLLVATLGAGNTIGAIVLASLGEIRQKGLLIVVTSCITGVGLLAFSQSGTLLLAFSILVAYGATMVITYTVAGVVIQSIVPDNIRGRVIGLYGTTLIAFPIGTLIVGGLAQLYGAPAATLVSGTALIAVVLLMSIAFRAEWSFNTGDEAKGCRTTEDTSQVGSADPGTQTVQSAIPRS
jgi:MFS family permease